MTGRRTVKKIETWIWLLIYGGLILGGLGLSIARSDAAIGWSVVAAGAAGALVGIVLIWLRSRINDH